MHGILGAGGKAQGGSCTMPPLMYLIDKPDTSSEPVCLVTGTLWLRLGTSVILNGRHYLTIPESDDENQETGVFLLLTRSWLMQKLLAYRYYLLGPCPCSKAWANS